MERLRDANPLPDPRVDPERAATLLERVLVETPDPRSPARRPRRRAPRRIAGSVPVAAAAAVLLLLWGGQPSGPDRLAVLRAFAQPFHGDDRILHVRTVLPGGPADRPQRVESWVRLAEPRDARIADGSGPGHLEEATAVDPASGAVRRTAYWPARNRAWIARHPWLRTTQWVGTELAKTIASVRDASLSEAEDATVRGRPAIRVRVGHQILFIARDAPVLLRIDLLNRHLQRVGIVSVLTYELLPDTPANRRLLRVPVPAGVRWGPPPPEPVHDHPPTAAQLEAKRRAAQRARAAHLG
jgi:hypothetical protein